MLNGKDKFRTKNEGPYNAVEMDFVPTTTRIDIVSHKDLINLW